MRCRRGRRRKVGKGDDVLVKVTNVMVPVKPMNGEYYTLNELQSYVGGYIETVRLGEKLLLVDEEGKIKGKLPNHIATGWLVLDGYHDWVAGDAMLIDRRHMR